MPKREPLAPFALLKFPAAHEPNAVTFEEWQHEIYPVLMKLRRLRAQWPDVVPIVEACIDTLLNIDKRLSLGTRPR